MQSEANTMFPGRDNYTGPDIGLLGLCENNHLWKPLHSFAEHIRIIKETKPQNEIAIRLHNLIYINLAVVPGIPPESYAHWQQAYVLWQEADTYWWATAAHMRESYARIEESYARRGQAYARRRESKMPVASQILAYIRAHIPDCAWNEATGKLIFPEVVP